ncbi:MAG: hypothetical protein M3N04_02635 [Actinomycetota bacterium]|nr:hypothetical protein [Actinomycetota bacterium]
MRTINVTLTTALAALTLAACGGAGGDDAATKASSAQDKALDGALKFARCMRAEGIDFPDPQKGANGPVRIGGAGQNPEDPRNRAAAEKCGKHLQDGGEAPDAAQQAKFQDAFVKYARCMRAAGVDVPDPKPGAGGLLADRRDPGALDPESPKFKAADRKCHSHLAAAGKAVQDEQSP